MHILEPMYNAERKWGNDNNIVSLYKKTAMDFWTKNIYT